MKKGNYMNKKITIVINITFSISYVYFILSYSMEAFTNITVPWEALSKVKHFLFQSELAIFQLAFFGISLVTVATLSFVLYKMRFSKFVVFLCGVGFFPTLVPVLCNAFWGPMIGEDYNIIWLVMPVFLLLYLITFQIFFFRDYKRISK